MHQFRNYATAFAMLAACGAVVADDQVGVVDGQTNVLLDVPLLESVGLALSGVSEDVIVPGDLGEGSVAFEINPRDGDLPTTFAYDEDDFLGTFSGTIEHAGSVFFNEDSIEVGDFTIGFDAARAGTLDGLASGFFVASTTGLEAVLFDVENPSGLDADDDDLIIEANLLVSPEFAGVLGDEGLAGVDVGDALVDADVDEICLADCNNDGQSDVLDFVCFQNEWMNQSAFGDCNGDGEFDVLDFVCFQQRFLAGCDD